MKQREIFCRVTGRVQMVMFRDFASRHARSLSVTGWVRNESDGSVSLLAQGEEEALRRLLESLRKGPLLAHVREVSTLWREPAETFNDFRIRYD